MERAVPPVETSPRRYRALGDVRFGTIAGTWLGIVLLRLGKRERGVALLKEGLAGLRLFGGAGAVASMLGTTRAPLNSAAQERILAMIRQFLDPDVLAQEQHAGREMRLDQLMAEAWAVADDAVSTGSTQ
jgi:hypothetical protein